MHIVTHIDTSLIKDPEHIALCARGFLHAVCLVNVYYCKQGMLPPLHRSGIRFRQEPWAGRFEEFADGVTMLRRGWADCDDFCAYRVGELWAAGERGARIRIYWRFNPRTGLPNFHVEVRRANGKVEDMARYQGMPGRFRVAA